MIGDTVEQLPDFLAERAPTIVFVCHGDGLDRWLVFGPSADAERLELAPLSAASVIDRYSDE